MKTNKIIAVWGNPNSGKSTVAVKLAGELARNKKNVVLVLCDNQCPTVTTILPGIQLENCSLGSVLTAPQITQEQILKSCIEVERVKNIAILGYINGENDMTYANYTRERAIDLFILLRHVADYVVVDCMSNVIADLLTAVALEVSDACLRLSTADLKGMFFFQSNLPLLADGRYHIDNHIKLLSNARDNEPRDIIAGQYHGIFGELPHTDEIVIQYLEGRLFEYLNDKKSNTFQKGLQTVISEILGEDADDTNNADNTDKKGIKKVKEKKHIQRVLKEKKAKRTPHNAVPELDHTFEKHPNRLFWGKRRK